MLKVSCHTTLGHYSLKCVGTQLRCKVIALFVSCGWSKMGHFEHRWCTFEFSTSSLGVLYHTILVRYGWTPKTVVKDHATVDDLWKCGLFIQDTEAFSTCCYFIIELVHDDNQQTAISSYCKTLTVWTWPPDHGMMASSSCRIDEPTCCSEFYPPLKAPPTLWHPSSIASHTKHVKKSQVPWTTVL